MAVLRVRLEVQRQRALALEQRELDVVREEEQLGGIRHWGECFGVVRGGEARLRRT